MNRESIKGHFDHWLAADGSQGELVDSVDTVAIVRYAPTNHEFVTFATLGLADSGIRSIYPQELVCSVVSGQDGAAGYIVKTCAMMCLHQNRGMVDQDIVPSERPLLASTNIYGVLTGAHPYLPGAFNLVRGENDEILANLVTLVPITGREVEFAKNNGVEALITEFEEVNPSLINILRPSAV